MQVLEEVNYLEQQADAAVKAVSSEQGGSGLLLCLCGFSEATLVSSHKARTHKSATWLLWMACRCDWFHDCVSCLCVAIKEIPHTLLTYSSFPLCKMFFRFDLIWSFFNQAALLGQTLKCFQNQSDTNIISVPLNSFGKLILSKIFLQLYVVWLLHDLVCGSVGVWLRGVAGGFLWRSALLFYFLFLVFID